MGGISIVHRGVSGMGFETLQFYSVSLSKTFGHHFHIVLVSTFTQEAMPVFGHV